MRINLTTPFAEKDQVKALGARWDSQRKLWYINEALLHKSAGCDLIRF